MNEAAKHFGTMPTAGRYPLTGVTVIDLGQIYNGPYAGFLMALAGAAVIKVESLSGEPLRKRAAVRGGSVPLAMLNSNKKDVSLNLKSKRGRELLVAMVKRADILIENFAPDTMQRLGVGPDVLLEANPRLIYASGSGYGRSGRDRDKLAMDITVQASSGAMYVTGFPDGPPVKAGPAICDFLGGIHLYAAAITALYDRERTGKGRLVEVAMQDATFPALASNIGMFFGAERGKVPPRTGNRHGGLSMAPYNVYRAKDGYVAIICVSEGHWRNLLRAMDCENLIDDPRFDTNAARCANMEDVDRMVGEWVGSMTRAETTQATDRFAVPAAPVRDLHEVVNDPHLHERGMLKWVDHPEVGKVVLPNSPLRYQGVAPMPLKPSPLHGEHNDEVFGDWLGLTRDDLDALQRDGVIGAAATADST